MFTFGAAEDAQGLMKKSDYERLINEFGAKPIDDEIILSFRKPHKFLLMELFYAHRDLDLYLREKLNGNPVSIVSGRGPSNYMHIGHLVIFEFVKWLQDELDAEVYIPLSDDEKYVFGKVKSLKQAYVYAIDNALDLIALGFKKGKTFFFVSTRLSEIYELSVTLSRYLTFNTVRATFGLEGEGVNSGVVFYAAVQAAHILLPTAKKGLLVLVPIAMDQDPYMRLTRDIALKAGFKKPAAIYSKYISGLTREPMSASKPETSVFLIDNEEEVRKKIWSAFTGGRPTIEEQRKLGGNPDICVVYEWLKVFVFKDLKNMNEHAYKCRSGELLCGECKRMLADALIKRLAKHKARKRQALRVIDHFFLHEVEIPSEIIKILE